MIKIEELRAELKLPPKEDAKLVGLLDEVVELWEQRTGRLWLRREDYVQVLVPQTDASRTLSLALWPVEEVTKVEELDQYVTSEWEELDSAYYRVMFGNVLEKRGFDTAWKPTVRVTYTGGYAAVGSTYATPGDVKRALITQIKFMLGRLSDSNLLIKSQNFEGGSGVFEEAALHPMFERVARQKARKS